MSLAKSIILITILLSSIGTADAAFGDMLIKNEIKILKSDQPLLLQEGYVLSIQDISPKGNKVWLVLQKQDLKHNIFGHVGDRISFRTNGTNNDSDESILLFSATIDSIFKNEKQSMVLFESFDQYSDNSSIGRIEIMTTIARSSIFLDGYHMGYTDERGIQIEGVLAGRHEIRASKYGYHDWVSSIDVADGRTVKIWIPLRVNPYEQLRNSTMSKFGTIMISADQTNTSIYFDRMYVGTAPLTSPLILSNITAGLHTIRIKKPGYKDWKTGVDVLAGRKHKFYAIMRIIPMKILEDQSKNGSQAFGNNSTGKSSLMQENYLFDIAIIGTIILLAAFAQKKW